MVVSDAYNTYDPTMPYDGMSYLTVDNGGGGGGIIQDQITPVYPTDEVFISLPQEEPQPVYYADPGGNPIDYTPTNDVLTDSEVQPQLIPSTDVQPVVDPGTAQTTETTPTTGNKFIEWIKANPLLAGGIGLSLLLLLSDKKQKAL